MALRKTPVHKSPRLDAEQLVGLEFTTDEFISLICGSIEVEADDGDRIALPESIGAVIVSFLRIQSREAVKVGDELWVRMESAKFRATVGYLQASYPWTSQQRKLNKEADAYLEGLQLWERYRVKHKLIDDADFGSVLSDDKLRVLKLIAKALPNRASKHASADLVTLYNTVCLPFSHPCPRTPSPACLLQYNLFYSFGVATRDIIGCGVIKQEHFAQHWELYGDSVETLAHHLSAEDIEQWRPAVDKICHFKHELLAEIESRLFPEDVANTVVRKIHLSTDMFRDRTKYIYDLYVGRNAVLFQRVHSD